jgi:beta-phosphoglucomutase-like phosphatase (HAD superfamily)
MNASPERCVVIEDSVPGVTGARSAGMTVLGFHGGSHCTPGHAAMLRRAGADLTFDDMRQLPDLIAQIGRNRPSVAGFSAS